mmetsp:Transcript_59658/g.122370  ORF Transcript_59658/g.122370 Transcript_59658/m.122370 type:complete len:359 (-) Transcript_59658:2738-3814(-)
MKANKMLETLPALSGTADKNTYTVIWHDHAVGRNLGIVLHQRTNCCPSLGCNAKEGVPALDRVQRPNLDLFPHEEAVRVADFGVGIVQTEPIHVQKVVPRDASQRLALGHAVPAARHLDDEAQRRGKAPRSTLLNHGHSAVDLGRVRANAHEQLAPLLLASGAEGQHAIQLCLVQLPNGLHRHRVWLAVLWAAAPHFSSVAHPVPTACASRLWSACMHAERVRADVGVGVVASRQANDGERVERVLEIDYPPESVVHLCCDSIKALGASNRCVDLGLRWAAMVTSSVSVVPQFQLGDSQGDALRLRVESLGVTVVLILDHEADPVVLALLSNLRHESEHPCRHPIPVLQPGFALLHHL